MDTRKPLNGRVWRLGERMRMIGPFTNDVGGN